MSTKSKRAWITGIYGQDGSYCAEYLFSLGYEVAGLAHRRQVAEGAGQTQILHERCTVYEGELGDLGSYKQELNAFGPDEVYNFAAVSDLKTAREHPEYTYAVNYTGARDLIEEVFKENPNVRFFQALSSRILQSDEHGVISETSPLAEPENAYDRAKRALYEEVVLPMSEKMFIASGFLCNHESPRRDARFVTGKIARTVALIKSGKEEVLKVGNVDARRDWSFAGDLVRGAHAALQIDTPCHYVMGSGTLHTVRDFISAAFAVVDIALTWEGEGVIVKARDKEGVVRVEVVPEFYQPDTKPVLGAPTLLTERTGWKPQVSFQELVQMMVRSQIDKV